MEAELPAKVTQFLTAKLFSTCCDRHSFPVALDQLELFVWRKQVSTIIRGSRRRLIDFKHLVCDLAIDSWIVRRCPLDANAIQFDSFGNRSCVPFQRLALTRPAQALVPSGPFSCVC